MGLEAILVGGGVVKGCLARERGGKSEVKWVDAGR